MHTEKLTCSIAGSFKFKPEIDRAIEAFEDFGVTVLEPTKGWIYIPTKSLFTPEPYRPLPNERGMSLKQIEDAFLAAIHRSDFLYLVNPQGYVGTSGFLELGYASTLKKPIFAQNEIDVRQEPLEFILYVKDKVKIKSVKETVLFMRSKFQ